MHLNTYIIVAQKIAIIDGRLVTDCVCRLMSSIFGHDLVPRVSRTGKGKSGNEIERGNLLTHYVTLKCWLLVC